MVSLFTFSVSAAPQKAKSRNCSVRYELHYRTADFLYTNTVMFGSSEEREVVCSLFKQAIQSADSLVDIYGRDFECIGSAENLVDRKTLRSTVIETHLNALSDSLEGFNKKHSDDHNFSPCK